MADTGDPQADALIDQYEEALLLAAYAAMEGRTTKRETERNFREIAERFLPLLFLLGGGLLASRAGQRFVEQQQQIHRRSARQFTNDIFARRYLDDAGQVKDDMLRNRTRLWSNQGVYAVNQGRINAPVPPGVDTEPLLIWRLGATERHCRDCAAFDGKVLTQSEWARLPAPQSPDLECGGWNCDCSLLPTDQPRTGITELGI